MDGLTVLVEAKKEYLAQLCSVMCPHMIEAFENMYMEADTISKGKKVLAQYQKLLKEVPNWNNHMIHQHVEKMSNTCGWFSDLLAAVFVSYVKILSSVRINSENKKISLKLPANDVFVHGCLTNAAKELYKDPYVYHEEMSEYDRDANLTRRFVLVIEKTVKDMIPIQEILKTYIAHKQDIEFENTTEDTEDPEVTEEGFGNDEPLGEAEDSPATEGAPAPEGEPGPEGAQVPAPPLSPEGSPAPAPESEIKNIPVNADANTNDDSVLFPDAK
jgi:hypothetical protein